MKQKDEESTELKFRCERLLRRTRMMREEWKRGQRYMKWARVTGIIALVYATISCFTFGHDVLGAICLAATIWWIWIIVTEKDW